MKVKMYSPLPQVCDSVVYLLHCKHECLSSIKAKVWQVQVTKTQKFWFMDPKHPNQTCPPSQWCRGTAYCPQGLVLVMRADSRIRGYFRHKGYHTSWILIIICVWDNTTNQKKTRISGWDGCHCTVESPGNRGRRHCCCHHNNCHSKWKSVISWNFV